MSTIIRSDRGGALASARWTAMALAAAFASWGGVANAQEAAPEGPPAAADPLDALRGRFREGMEKYRARAFGDAIVIWESIYRELGPEKGYRVAFDLGRAYDEIGELIKAAEHYQTYLDRVAARRQAGESLETNVQLQETIARERLERIIHIYGAIHVAAGRRTVVVHVDNAPPRVAGFTVYVEPGPHTVTFGTGSAADVRAVTVRRGELLELEPHEEEPVLEPRFETRIEHPFSPVVVWVAAGVAVASVVIPVITYANALSIKSDYEAPGATEDDKRRLDADYQSARSNAYASIAIPAVLGAAAGGLALWYALGRKETRIPMPSASVTPQVIGASLSARF
ncbi:MAG TPA: hypothetical protein VLT33_46255 [Labilithrix sp.]|nr:hypothetical protein [Labilithrix sp.]